ncbi:MAG TPA: VIT domain-containing protein [Kofleriaceae bacterium]|nr:VIT domain-containing protein [Kofleriaceae bacterium]
MSGLPIAVMSDDEVAGYGAYPDAGFGALETARGLLPLVAMDVDARVAGIIATIEVAQTFVNTTGVAIEATYIFPLPDRAAVHRFQIAVAGRVIDGVIDDRGAARQTYDRAIAAGHRAAIAEEERAGVFSLRVGNLMPGDAATVRLSLVGPLPIDDGEVTFRFPLVVAPRYIPGGALGGPQAGLGTAADTDLVPDGSRISPPVRLPGCPNPVRLGLRVAFDSGDRGGDRGGAVMRDVASSLHAVVVRKHDAQIVELQAGERLDRDFILRWRIDGRELTSSLVCLDDAGGGAGTFALTVVPPSTAAVAAVPRDVVFVIDRSGSMEGWKMVAARRAAARMIDTLTSRDRFCAIAFDDASELLPAAGLADATDRNRFRAVEGLAKIEARGGTELAGPLRRALYLLAGGTLDRERVIVLVTDGQVGNEDQILREIAPRLRNIKMFTLGIDQAVNAAFLRRLAGAGGGLCELVESEDRLDAVMTKVHRRIGTPIATELAVHATGLELERGSLAPSKLPDVYAGAPIVILGRYRGRAAAGAAIELAGASLGDPFRMTVTVSSPSSGDATSWLAASWARARIRELEDQYAAGARGELERDIVQTSKQYSVLSRFTAFVAVDRSQRVNAGGAVHPVVQPVEPPAGWAGSARRPGGGVVRARISSQRPLATGIVVPARIPSQRPPSAGGYGGGYGGSPGAQVRGAPPPPAAAPMTQPPTGGYVPPAGGPAIGSTMPPGGLDDALDGEGDDLALEAIDAESGHFAVEVSEDEMFRLAPSAVMPAPVTPAPAAKAAAAPAPGAPPAPQSQAVRMPALVKPVLRESSAGKGAGDGVLGTTDAAYREALAQLARTLMAEAIGACDPGAIRLLRQRLTQWAEDACSAGYAALAAAVELQIERLSAALGAPASLVGEARAVAHELETIAADPAAPPAPPPSRPAFWK